MKVAFIHTGDISDRNLWSGSVYYLYKNLSDRFEEVVFFRPQSRRYPISKLFFRSLSKLIGTITGKLSLDLYSGYFLPRSLGRSVDKFTQGNFVDCIISTTSIPFVYTKNKVPLVMITDATVKLLFKEYFRGRGWSKLSYNLADKNALKVTGKAAFIVSSSHSTTNSLMKDYNIPGDKIVTIPFGANIDNESIKVVPRIIEKDKPVNFLFIGKDWERKGGEFAVSVCDELIKRNINTQLFIVGCKIPEKYQRSYITSFIYLNKNQNDDFSKLKELFRRAHFFMVFSNAEMYGIVFCEAAAYGLPSISFSVGGIRDIIVNEQTGLILPKDTGPDVFATKIVELIDNPAKYNEMSNNARVRYEKLLNWNSFTTSLRKEIEQRIYQTSDYNTLKLK